VRSSTRSRGSALVALTLACAGCGVNNGPPPVLDAEGCPVVTYRGVSAEAAFPTGSFDHVATYADQVSVFTVTDERRGEPSGAGDAPWIPRWVTVRVDDTVWSGARATDPTSGVGLAIGDRVEVLTWPSEENDDCIGISPGGNPTLRPGRRYVGAIVFHQAEYGLYPGASAVLDDASLALRAELLDGLVAPSDYGDRMTFAEPDPVAADVMLLDPSERMQTVVDAHAAGDPPPATDSTGNTFPP